MEPALHWTRLRSRRHDFERAAFQLMATVEDDNLVVSRENGSPLNIIRAHQWVSVIIKRPWCEVRMDTRDTTNAHDEIVV